MIPAMDERLKGRTILIGRDPAQAKLMLAMDVDGGMKMGTIGQAGEVPASVSRCLPAAGTAHCSIMIDQEGIITLNNLNDRNATRVGGVVAKTKRVTESSAVTLGKDGYQVNVGTLLKASALLVGPPVYSISGLEAVWNEYDDGLSDLQKSNNRMNIICSVPLFFTFASGAVTAIAKMNEWPEWVSILTTALTIAGFVMFIAGLVMRLKFGGGVQKKKDLNKKFHNSYVCPNPDCQRFVGNQPYDDLKKSTACPYCKCKWTQ